MTGRPRDAILLTGASGRVGRMVLWHWRARPGGRASITAQYRGTAPPDALLWDPLAGPRALLDHIARTGTRFRALVMLAGVTPGPGAQPLSDNLAIAQATLAAAQEAGIGRVLLASSSAVYGPGEALREEAALAPVTAYGQAKLDMEAACTPFRAGGLEICALRIGNVAGADALLLNIAKAAQGARIGLDIFADGAGPLRSYIGPRSMAGALETLCLQPGPLPPVLNFAAPRPVTMAALAEAAGALVHPRPAPPTAHQRITLDCTRLAALHGFAAPESTPAEMIRQWRASAAAEADPNRA